MNKTSISDNNIYPEFCELAATNRSVFGDFRSNSTYKEILEHVSENEGKLYLEIIMKNNPNLILNNLDKYKINDEVGKPAKYNYDIGRMSPTTIRYIKVLSDLIKEFGDLSNLDIVEIGCGYGGQCKIIMDTYKVKSYTLIDLEPVLKLTKKYLEATGVDLSKIKFLTLDELTDNLNYDLFISNYAFTECNKTIQLAYFDKVITNSKMGYITANFINQYFNLDYLSKEELLSMINNSYEVAEEPKTHQNNVLILWK